VVSVVPTDTNFSIVRGDDISWTLTVTFPPSAGSSNLNDYQIALTAKYRFTDPDASAAFRLVKPTNIAVDGVSVAVAHFSCPSSKTAGIPCVPPLNKTSLVYDVQIIGPDARPFTVARGTITVLADATLLDV
jgi:hypothetical protein